MRSAVFRLLRDLFSAELPGEEKEDGGDHPTQSVGHRSGLLVCYSPPPPIQPLMDIVFVHGLGGDRVQTWTNGDGVFWPRDWLPRRLFRCRVLTFGYDNEATAWLGNAIPLSRRAHSLLGSLHAAGVGSYPFLLVGHSMGGPYHQGRVVHGKTGSHSSVFRPRWQLPRCHLYGNPSHWFSHCGSHI